MGISSGGIQSEELLGVVDSAAGGVQAGGRSLKGEVVDQPGEVLHLPGERGHWEPGPAGHSSDLEDQFIRGGSAGGVIQAVKAGVLVQDFHVESNKENIRHSTRVYEVRFSSFQPLGLFGLTQF